VGRSTPLSYGPGHYMIRYRHHIVGKIGVQTSHCRQDWYMGMYAERFLVVFFSISWSLL